MVAPNYNPPSLDVVLAHKPHPPPDQPLGCSPHVAHELVVLLEKEVGVPFVCRGGGPPPAIPPPNPYAPTIPRPRSMWLGPVEQTLPRSASSRFEINKAESI